MVSQSTGEQLTPEVSKMHKPDVYIGAQPLRLSVLKCLCLLNSGHKEINLIGVGQSISQTFACAHQLSDFPGVKVGAAGVHLMKREVENRKIKLTCTVIPITYDASNQDDDKHKWDFGEVSVGGVLSLQFPAAEMLLQDVLFRKKAINIKLADDILLSVHYDAQTGFYIKSDHWKLATRVDSKFGDSLLRAGMLMSPSWQPISDAFGEFDDVILGLDTNILYNCILTRQLIEGFVLNSLKSHKMTPNWILIVIPQAVINELEYAANHRNSYGRLTHIGRKAFRALGEIFQMHTLDITGLSIMVCGESEGSWNLSSEVRLLRQDMLNMRNDFMRLKKDEVEDFNENQDGYSIFLEKKFRSMSIDDVSIRTQFKQFLRNAQFSKGAYFLTSDRVSHGLARTESINSLYYEKGDMYRECKNSLESKRGFSAHKLYDATIDGEGRPICIRVTLARLLYELATEYEEVELSWQDDNKNQSIRMCTDQRGMLDDWIDDVFYIRDGNKTIRQLRDHKYSGLPISKMLEVWEKNKGKINV